MEESNCNHIFYKSKINEHINYCYTCGVVKYQNVSYNEWFLFFNSLF